MNSKPRLLFLFYGRKNCDVHNQHFLRILSPSPFFFCAYFFFFHAKRITNKELWIFTKQLKKKGTGLWSFVTIYKAEDLMLSSQKTPADSSVTGRSECHSMTFSCHFDISITFLIVWCHRIFWEFSFGSVFSEVRWSWHFGVFLTLLISN